MTTLNLQVGTSADDGRRVSGSLGFSATEGNPYVGYSKAGNLHFMHEFARFTGVSGLSGATIGSALFYIWCWGNNGSPLTKVRADDQEAPPAPTNASEFDSISLTTAGVDWDGPLPTGGFTPSPDIKTVIQELATSYDPSVIQILHKDDGSPGDYNYTQLSHYDFSTARAAKLDIDYTAGGPTVVEGAASVSGAGAVTATNLVLNIAAATPSGAGAITASAFLVIGATASISGTGAVSPASLILAFAASSISGTGAVTATGQVLSPAVEGAAVITGEGSVTAASLVQVLATSSVSGVGDVTAAALLILPSAASVSGAGTVTATGQIVGGAVEGAAVITGAGAISATSLVRVFATSALSGTGSVTATGLLIRTATATIAGNGSFAAEGLLVVFATAAPSGAGSVIAVGTVIEAGDPMIIVAILGSVDTKFAVLGSVDTKFSVEGSVDTKFAVLGSVNTKFSVEGAIVAKENQNFELYAGEDVVVTDTVAGEDITGWALRAVFGANIIKDNNSIGGITITDPTNGVFEIALSDDDTSLPEAAYIWGVKRDDPGSETVLSVGVLNVKGTPVNG